MDNSELSNTLPLAEEVLTVDKRVEDGRQIRVHTRVEHRQELLRETLQENVVDVQRVPIGEFVTEAPQIREEGDLVIVPVIEERIVVERRLFLVEEVRIRRSTREVQTEIPATRRVMHADIEEIEADQ